MSEITSLEGPVDQVGDSFVLEIPLDVGGAALAPAARGIGVVEDGCLLVTIPAWLATQLQLTDGAIVQVDNRDGKFNIRLATA